jgi:biopolymer transport protein ExbD
MACSSIASVFAVENDRFSIEIGGVKPVLWKDEERLYPDFVRCIAGSDHGRLTPQVCEQIHSQRNHMFGDALKQAVQLNVTASATERFCYSYGDELLRQNRDEDAAEIAMGIVEMQLHGGNGLYGTQLSETYIGKIVFDGLVKQFPCRSPVALTQSAPPDANPDVLTIRISEDGVCHLLDASTPCDQLGQYLLTNHLAQNGHIHIAVDRSSKYELVATTLESLRRTGFKVGFVNYDASSSQ